MLLLGWHIVLAVFFAGLWQSPLFTLSPWRASAQTPWLVLWMQKHPVLTPRHWTWSWLHCPLWSCCILKSGLHCVAIQPNTQALSKGLRSIYKYATYGLGCLFHCQTSLTAETVCVAALNTHCDNSERKWSRCWESERPLTYKDK